MQCVGTADVDVAIPLPSSAALRVRLAGMRTRLAEAEGQALDAVLPQLSKLTAEPAGKDHRNHHFIPKFWLENFADDRRVCVADPSGQQRLRPAHIRRAFRERDLYAVRAAGAPSASDVTVMWEHVTRIVDDRAAPLFDRLTAARDGSSWTLTNVDRYWLSVFLALQSVRVPGHLSSTRASADRVFQMFATSLATRGSPRDWMTDEDCREAGINLEDLRHFEWSPEDFEPGGKFSVSIDPLSDIPFMLSQAFDVKLVLPFFARSWLLVRFPQGGLTLPADTGMHLVSYKGHGIWDARLLTADQILVPLSRHTLLVMHWHGDAWQAHGLTAEGIAAVLGRKGEHQICHPDDAEHLTRIWDACRRSIEHRDALIRASSNIGVTLAVV